MAPYKPYGTELPCPLAEQLKARGIRLTIDGDRLLAAPKQALTDELRAELASRTPELVRLLGQAKSALFEVSEVIGEVPGEAERRERAEQQLTDGPHVSRAIYADAEAPGMYVPVAVAIRGVGSFEVLVPKDRFNTSAFIELISARRKTM